jgi:hypothetical protein
MRPHAEPPGPACTCEFHAVGADAPRDVLHILLAGVFEREVAPALQHMRCRQHVAWWTEFLESRGDVDAIAIDVVIDDHDVGDP